GTGALDICPGTCWGYRGFLSDPFADGAGKVWFSGQAAAEGAELWISDLTRPGTRRIKDLSPGPFSSDPHDFLAVDRRVFFVTGVSHDDEAVWVSDGRAAGTRRLAGPAGADRFLNVGFGAALAGRAVFRLDDGVHGAEPWISSGTVAGTALVADLEPAQLGGSRPQALTRVGDRCFFFTTLPDVEEAHELWVSDGTAAGTERAFAFEPPFDLSRGVRGVELGGRLVFYRATGFEEGEIWASDGTPEGTVRLAGGDLRASGILRVVGSRLFFLAADSAHGGELWTSDGTPEGTVRLSDFANPEPFPDSGSQKRQGLRALGGRVAFSAADELGRFEPWVSDGTIGGTRHLADVYPALVAPFFELSSEVVELGGRFFFVSGEGSEVGTEPALWVSDLTPAGTRIVGPLADRAGRATSEVALVPLGARVLLFYSAPEESGFLSTDGASLVPGGRAGLGSDPIAW